MTSPTTGLGSAVIIPVQQTYLQPAGGRRAPVPTTLSKRTQVILADSRTDQRFVSVTTARLHATNVYVVALVDGTDRLISNLSTFTDPRAATRAADRLVTREGGKSTAAPEPTPPPEPTKTGRKAKPRRKNSGRWRASPTYQGKTHHATFDTKQEAQQFINRVKAGGKP